MTLVDSSVWIGFLRGDKTDVEAVSELLRGRNQASLCGPVLQEVLQGIRLPDQRKKTSDFLLRLPVIATKTEHHVRAADVYAHLRKRGVTVPSMDVLIAILAVSAGQGILTRDHHFEEIRKELTFNLVLL